MTISMTRLLALALAAASFLAVSPASSGSRPNEAVPDQSAHLTDVEYLTQLGLIRGHLRVGLALYRRGEEALAKTHMKHPGDELYAGLSPEFERRGGTGFGDELERLARAVETDATLADVEAAYAALLDRIAAAERLVGFDDARDGAQDAHVIRGLLHHAREEYAVGVRDGRIADLHEYQDAWGFAQTALDRANAARRNTATRNRWAAVTAELEALAPLWPDIVSGGAIPDVAEPFAAVLATLEGW